MFFKDYKGTRGPMPEDLHAQLKDLKDLLSVMGIKTLEKSEIEADDIVGTLTRKFNEESQFGALLDIMGDRIVENTYWILFAVMGWINILFPLIAITRGFVTDTIRSAAMEQGLTPFGMQVNPICKFITGSKFMRISYAVAKVVAFVLIVTAKIPVCPHAEFVWNTGYWSAIFALIFCVVRGLPVIIEAKYLFEKK